MVLTISKPVQSRPGRQGNWGYPNTDALGLMEYMQWCTDMGMEPLLAVWSGLTIGGGVVSGTALDPYVDDILNELEFLLGDSTTTYGALRAQYGQTAAYNLTYIEVGNEDNLNSGCSTYASRFTAIYDAIHAKYPDLVLIASTSSTSCLPATMPTGTYADTHHYLTPDQFVSSFNEWDNYARSGAGVVVGEYASTAGNDGSTTYWSTMQGSCGEAVYMIGRSAPRLRHSVYLPDLPLFSSCVTSGANLLARHGTQQRHRKDVKLRSAVRAFRHGGMVGKSNHMNSTTPFKPVNWHPAALADRVHCDTQTARSVWSQLHGRVYHRIYLLLGTEHVLREPRRHCSPCDIGLRFRSRVLGGIFGVQLDLLRQTGKLRIVSPDRHSEISERGALFFCDAYFVEWGTTCGQLPWNCLYYSPDFDHCRKCIF